MLLARAEPLRARPGAWLAVVTGVLGVAVATSGVTALVVGRDTEDRPAPKGADRAAPPTVTAASAAATRFLDRYLDPAGRVVRHDHGGDTVSEGQSYAMLLAVAVGDRARFDRAWQWSVEHLRRPDGLLSWRWVGGRIADAEAATDADVDAAHALLLAADRFGEDRYRQAAVELATSILEGESVDRAGGQVLVAGPWARRGPTVVNPSYLAPVAFRLLAEATGDARWHGVAVSGSEVLDQLMAEAPHLVPDWAEVRDDGARATAAPGRSAEPAFGLDAARTLVRLAVSCDGADRHRAARAWPFLRGAVDAGRLVAAYRLDGSPATNQRHPLMYVAAAASAAAAGATDRVGPLLDAADRVHRRGPSYYGAAWVALGRVLLTDDPLGGCAP